MNPHRRREEPCRFGAELGDGLRLLGGDVDDPVRLENGVVGNVGLGATLPAQESDGLDRRRLAWVELVVEPQPLGKRFDGRGLCHPQVPTIRPAQAKIGSVTEDLVREELVADHGAPPRRPE